MKLPPDSKNLDIDLPKVGQLGFAVSSIEENLPRFSTLFGVKSWYKPRYAQKAFMVDGQDFDLDLDLVVGFSGGLQTIFS